MIHPKVKYIPAKPPQDPTADKWYDGAGWYYFDAVGMLSGPYSSLNRAFEAREDA